MSYAKDISDIPLKPPQETFVDEPASYEDVQLEELLFDLSHKIKDINRLHVFHAIAVVATTFSDIIKLQSDPQLFARFRDQQLSKYNLTVKTLVEKVDDGNNPGSDAAPLSTPDATGNTSPILPPAKYAKLSQDHENLSEESLKETTPDSLSNDCINESNEALVDTHSTIDHNLVLEENEEVKIISIESLVASTSLDTIDKPITALSRNRLQVDLDYFQQAQINNQVQLLLKTFNLVKIPNISLEKYLIRIKTYSSSISVLSYIHSACMIYKLSVLFGVVPLSQHNAYRLLLALIRCLTKKLEDLYQKQKSFATVGGVSQKELFKIEVGFLYLCNFRVVVGQALLNNFLHSDFLDLHNFCVEHFKEETSQSETIP